MHVVQRLLVFAIFAVFAVLGTWIALFGEAGQFSGSVSGFGIVFGTGVAIGRIAFGFGAFLCWIATIAMAVSMVRKLAGVRG